MVVSLPSPPVRARPRLQFIDTTRGVAMGLVCLSHFSLWYFTGAAAREGHIIFHLALPATTTFMLVSGVVLGVQFKRSSAAGLKDKLIDRGLFLLGPAHVLIRLAHWRMIAAAPASSHWLFVTDSIGVCLLIGASLIPRIGGSVRLAIALVLFAACWLIYLCWSPTIRAEILIKDYLFGESATAGVVFPILPWFALYLGATTLGEQIAIWDGSGQRLDRRLAQLGIPLLFVGGALHFGRNLIHDPGLRGVLSAGQKYPPGLAYLTFGSGCAVLLLATVAWLESGGYLERARGLFGLVGRASLVVFVTQYYVYYLGLAWLHLPWSPFWPVYFALSLLINFGSAVLWERLLGNQYLTVGWPWQRRPSRHRARSQT